MLRRETYKKALGPWLISKTCLSPIKIMVRKSTRFFCFKLRRMQKKQQYRQPNPPMSHIIDQPNVLVALPEVVITTGHEPMALDYCPQSIQDSSTSPSKAPVQHVSKKSTSCSQSLLQNSPKPAFHKDLKLVVK